MSKLIVDEIEDKSSGDLTLDVTGDIILDADGADVVLKDGGTEFGKISNSSTDMVISASVASKDIIFKGQGTGASTEIARFDTSATSFLVSGTNKIEFTTSAAYINHDGTDLQIVDDADVNIKPAVNFLVDAGGDIILDADSGAWVFKDGGGTAAAGEVGRILSGSDSANNAGGALVLSASSAQQLIILKTQTTSGSEDYARFGQDQILFLTGAVDGVGADTNFFVSGTRSAIGGAGRHVAVFGGDMLASGSFTAKTGLSGSLTHLSDGKSYLAAGSNVTITSASNGQVSIASTGGGSVAGSDTQLQYNNGGAFGGTADLTFNDSTGDTTVGTSTGDAKLFFRDAGIYAYSKADGELDIISDTKLSIIGSGSIASAVGIVASNTAGGIDMDSGTGGYNNTSTGRLALSSSLNSGDGAAIQMLASAGGIDIDAVGAAGEDISITNTGGSVNLTATEAAVGAIYLRENAGAAGTIKIHADQGTSVTEGAASIQLLTDAGGIGIKSTANLANAILLTTDGGTSETIKIHADRGTAVSDTAASIQVTSDAGAVTLNAGLAHSSSIKLKSAAGGITLESMGSLGGVILRDAGSGGHEMGRIYSGSDPGGGGGGAWIMSASVPNQAFVFKTQTTAGSEDYARFGGGRVLFLTGASATTAGAHGGGSVTNVGADTNFFVSGTTGTIDGVGLGTAVFGGDLLASGSLHVKTTGISLKSDSATVKFGADSDIVLTHDHNYGLTLTQDTDATQEPVFTLKSTGNLASGPMLHFLLDNGAGEADDDVLGTIKFSGDDSGDAETIFAQMTAISSDVTNADEGGQFKFEVMAGGGAGTAAMTELLSVGGPDVTNSTECSVVVNEAGMDCNFRVESNDVTHAIYVDGGTGKVGVHASAPEATLSIGGGKHIVSVEQDLRFADSTDNTVIVELSGVVIPAGSIITSAAAVMKAGGVTGGGVMTTYAVNIQLSATSGTAADSAVSTGTEILGAGATGTKSSDSDSVEDINLAYDGGTAVDPKETWINQTLVKSSADAYVYVCNAGTGNGTTNPIAGTLLIMIEYYGLT